MTPGTDPPRLPARPRERFPLWIPFFLIWLFCLPLVLMAAPLVFVGCLVLRVSPLRGVAVYWQLFAALRGLRIIVEDPNASVSIRIF